MNTCSIKFLPKAYIGAGIRMTKDKNTVEFDNKPMKGLKIIGYTNLGFRIKHESLPKPFWVDFCQLPLTRLTIKHGVIEDEITFVENIVNHKMQLIRTLDTEYIDLIYSQKELDTSENIIIPVTKAIPGTIYKGARCKDGTEMIFLGNFYIKSIKGRNNYSYFSSKPSWTIVKDAPRKAFFVIPVNVLGTSEIEQLEKKFRCGYCDEPSRPSNRSNQFGFDDAMEIYNHKLLIFKERKVKCELAKKELLAATPMRYKIKDYSITSKVIKNLILTTKSVDSFNKYELNLDLINQSIIEYQYSHCDKNSNTRFQIDLPYKTETDFVIISSPDYTKVFDTKTDIDKKFREFIDKYGNQKVDDYIK